MKNTVLVFFLLACSALRAQDQHIHKDRETLSAMDINDNGMVMEVGSNLVYLNAQCEVVWEKPMDYKKSAENKALVTSASGDVVYMILSKDYSTKPHYLNQVRKGGELRNLEVQGKKEFGKNLQSVFCDDQYLYYLFTQNGDERSDKKRSQEKLIMNRFRNDDLSYKSIVLDLPAVASDENTTFWSYLGQKETEKYLASKEIDRQASTSVFHVVAIDAEGKVVRKYTLSLSLDGKFVRPSEDVLPLQNNKENLDFDEFYHRSQALYSGHAFTPSSPNEKPIIPSATSLKQKMTNGAFGYIRMDQANGHLYVYGLSGPKPFKNVASVYDGFYVAKYDLEGKQLWKAEVPGSKQLMEESFFRIHGTPVEREIALKILPAGKSIFSIHFRKELFEFELSSEGKVLGSLHKTDVMMLTGNIFSSVTKLKSEAFIKKSEAEKKDKWVYYLNGLTSSGEFVIRGSMRESTFDLYYFKN